MLGDALEGRLPQRRAERRDLLRMLGAGAQSRLDCFLDCWAISQRS